MNIRPAHKNDLPQLDKLQSLNFDANTAENFKVIIENDIYIIIVAEENSEIIGYLCASKSIDSSDLLQICVAKEYRRKKVATQLLTYYVSYLKRLNFTEILLEVNENNKPAISLYENFEFEKISTRKNYYGKDSAIIMKKYL